MDPLRRQTLVIGLAVLLSPGAAFSETPDLAVGQEWSVKDTSAKVVIGRIETLGRFQVVSVSIFDVPTDHGPTNFGHAPFEKAALIASLDRIVANGVAPDPNFDAGYQQWKSAHGGFFTISVAGAIAATLSILPPSSRPPPGQPAT